MLSNAFLSLLALTGSVSAAETILGAYIFHRHGDRTPKSTPPTSLTTLGYSQVYTSGQYFRSRYAANSSSARISGLSADTVKLSQISVSAPQDNVLLSSAQGFLQGLYPPVGASSTQTLGNGTQVQAPMDGYQLIPISITANGQGSEDNAWLQDASNCDASSASSNEYFSSPEYTSLLSSAQPLYDTIKPVVNATFPGANVTFKNAYTVWDLLNVARIHNASVQSQAVLSDNTFEQLGSLANVHEWNLAYNASSPVRAITGAVLAAEIVQYLNSTITSKGKGKLGVQFGAYASFLSFFGLAGLGGVQDSFMGIPDYASAMVFELFTDADASAAFPAARDLKVRFLFHNGTTSNASEPVAYPLFGQSQTELSWTDFAAGMDKFAVGTTEQWCKECGNVDGSCLVYAPKTSSGGGDAPAAAQAQHGGLSTAVAGVIGAMVTLAVVLGVQAAILLAGGLRLVSKRRLQGAVETQQVTPKMA